MVGAAAAQPPLDSRLSALFVDPNSLVGLEEKVEDLSRLVMDGGSRTELKIISIVGMAGSGKTTLANAVYQRLKAQDNFQCSAFISIGPKVDMVSKAVGDMLSQLSGNQQVRHRAGQDINQLITSVREILANRRYLILVDDLWSSEQCATIWCCFPHNSLGSRIITTSRNDAHPTDSYSSSTKVLHKISLLSDTDAKKLFLKKAFSNRNDCCPQHLEDVFNKVVRRCGGLPLSVVSIAAKLAHKHSADEWEKVGLNLLYSSHSSGSEVLKQILNLSFNDLQPHLRTCLLYLSIFPENSEVDTERLVRRWIAEGFIAQRRSISAEEIALGYLNELIGRNLVQPLNPNHEGVPRRCRVHPVIYDFIVCKSMEENFTTLMNVQHVPNNDGTVRRLSLKNSNRQDKRAEQNESMDLSHARSITIFGHASATPQLTNLKVVRVLDLEGCDGPVCLEGLCKLVLLRYLSLKGTDASELPPTIGDLNCLETLDVRSTKVKVLPPSIIRLEKLMHLLAGSAKVPDGVTKMKGLQTLSCGGTAKSSVNFIEEISKHDNLRELELYSDATETPENKKIIMFPADGFRRVKKLCIRCSSPLVTFEPNALPAIQVLDLRFQKGLADESSGVSGMENLSSLKHVLLEFEQHDVSAMATIDAVRNAAQKILPDHSYITIKVDGKSY